MHCPTCGQQQISDDTRFCSRCGFPLMGIAEVVANKGLLPDSRKTGFTGTPDSPRRRGIKQGIFMFLLAFLIVPLTAVLSLALNLEPYLPLISTILLGVGALLRVAYALLFEEGVPSNAGAAGESTLQGIPANRAALPPQQSIPASAYGPPKAGSWRDTNDLQHQGPGSVTDTTTKLLQKEEGNQ